MSNNLSSNADPVRFLNDYAARTSEDARAPDIAPGRIFQEILLSYRVLFGQDSRSWKAFKNMGPLVEEQRGRSSWETTWDCDPLLSVLCGRSYNDEESRKIYEEIDANEPAEFYYADSDFPYFGKRLLEVQQLVKQYQPQDVRSLLNDRRDVAAWYDLKLNQVFLLVPCLISTRHTYEMLAGCDFCVRHNFSYDLVT